MLSHAMSVNNAYEELCMQQLLVYSPRLASVLIDKIDVVLRSTSKLVVLRSLPDTATAATATNTSDAYPLLTPTCAAQQSSCCCLQH
jgi:hypothetical protein